MLELNLDDLEKRNKYLKTKISKLTSLVGEYKKFYTSLKESNKQASQPSELHLLVEKELEEEEDDILKQMKEKNAKEEIKFNIPNLLFSEKSSVEVSSTTQVNNINSFNINLDDYDDLFDNVNVFNFEASLFENVLIKI